MIEYIISVKDGRLNTAGKECNMLFIEYPKCSTCRKAKKHLEDCGVDFEDRNIIEEDFPVMRMFLHDLHQQNAEPDYKS